MPLWLWKRQFRWQVAQTPKKEQEDGLKGLGNTANCKTFIRKSVSAEKGASENGEEGHLKVIAGLEKRLRLKEISAEGKSKGILIQTQNWYGK